MAKAIKKKRGSLGKEMKNKEVTRTPFAIKLIAIISYVAAALFIFAGIGLTIGGVILQQESDVVNSFLQVLIANPNSQLSAASPIAKTAISAVLSYSGPVLIALGLVFFFVGIFRLFVGFNFFHGKSWSRVVVICFCTIWIGFGLYSMTKGVIWINILTILFNLVVLHYLLFSHEARAFFHHDHPKFLHPNKDHSHDTAQQKITEFMHH